MNCNRIAPYYETLEHLAFGRSLERSRFAFLEQITTAQRAILCGGGDGRFLAALLRVNSQVEVDYVELSSRMIELAETRVTRMGDAIRKRVRFREGDVRKFEPRAEGYDLIVTHFFLDCFSDEELPIIVGRLAKWGTPGARWIVSEFREGETPVSRILTRAVIRLLYAGFKLTTGLRIIRLPDYMAALADQGFVLSSQHALLGGLLHSSMWSKGTS